MRFFNPTAQATSSSFKALLNVALRLKKRRELYVVLSGSAQQPRNCHSRLNSAAHGLFSCARTVTHWASLPPAGSRCLRSLTHKPSRQIEQLLDLRSYTHKLWITVCTICLRVALSAYTSACRILGCFSTTNKFLVNSIT